MLAVVDRLVKECDRAVKQLIASWEKDRSIGKVVRASLPIQLKLFTECQMSACDVRSLPTSRRAGPPMSATDEQQVQPREVDKLLNELAAVIMRASAYRRFLYVNLHVSFLLCSVLLF